MTSVLRGSALPWKKSRSERDSLEQAYLFETERPTQTKLRAITGNKSAEIRGSFVPLRGPCSPRLITQRHSAYPTNNLS